jgi:hypothetical protein
LKSDLGLTPSSDGKLIRIAIPPLTEERRKELVKVVSKMCEEHKIAIRNIRRDSNELLKGFKKDGDISEDDAFKGRTASRRLPMSISNASTRYTKKKRKKSLNSSSSANPRMNSTPMRIPVHVAIIMDGNGRWAKKRLLNRIKGHEKGAEP